MLPLTKNIEPVGMILGVLWRVAQVSEKRVGGYEGGAGAGENENGCGRLKGGIERAEEVSCKERGTRE